MKFRQIEVFSAVFLTGTVSAAARSLGVSQPTVSKLLRRFEDELGFRLFERVSGRLVPTHRATTLFEAAAPTFEHLAELKSLTRHLATQGDGHLRFAMVPAFVNGADVIRNGAITGARPGRALRRCDTAETIHAQ